MNIGVSTIHLDRVTFGLTCTYVYGAEETSLDSANHFTFKQTLKDRDYLAFSVSTTF